MKRGRKPKPTKKKELQGNPGRRPLPKNEPEFKGTTTPPKWLDATAKTEWRRLAPRLELIGILTPADRVAFATYCAAYSRMVKAETFLQSPAAGGSLVFRTEGGAIKQWPHVVIFNQAARICREFISEFGLTPSSRTRLDLGDLKKTDSAEDFLFGAEESDADGKAPN